MTGGPDAMGIPVPVGLLGEQHIVVDIVYQPRETPLLAAATARGARAINGVGMLVHQAALSFERWTKHAAPIEAMRAAAFPDALTGRSPVEHFPPLRLNWRRILSDGRAGKTTLRRRRQCFRGRSKTSR